MRILDKRLAKLDAPKALTHNQCCVLEALRRLQEATVTEIANEMNVGRNNMKHAIPVLIRRGYIVPLGTAASWNGSKPVLFKWSGKDFLPSTAAAVAPRRPSRSESIPPSPEIAVLINSINAMVHIGRSAA